MTVIPLPDRWSSARAPGGCSCRSIPIHGTFRSPRGRSGTMRGSLRLQRLSMTPEGACAEGVFTGELFDADGSRVGTGSRRQSAPAGIGGPEGSSVTIGPLDIDLMGFVISVPAISVPAPCAVGDCTHQDGGRP